MEAGGLSTGFGRFDGLWGVFRLFQNADERPLGAHMVQWSEIRGRGRSGGSEDQPAGEGGIRGITGRLRSVQSEVF